MIVEPGLFIRCAAPGRSLFRQLQEKRGSALQLRTSTSAERVYNRFLFREGAWGNEGPPFAMLPPLLFSSDQLL